MGLLDWKRTNWTNKSDLRNIITLIAGLRMFQLRTESDGLVALYTTAIDTKT